MTCMKRRASLAVLAAALAAAGLALRAAVAANPPIVVNSHVDAHDVNPGDGTCEIDPGNGVCTLRAAIEEANALSGAHTITFSPSLPNPTTFLLNLGHLQISTDLTITGNGSSNTIIDGDGSATEDRVFQINGSSVVSVTISALTIQNGGSVPTTLHGGGIAAFASFTAALRLSDVVLTRNTGSGGGGIFSIGILTLDHCTISNNSASVFDGGGIENSGTMTVISSTIESNAAAGSGGGLHTASGGSTTLLGSTVQLNNSASSGGGLNVVGNSTLNLVDSTVTGNVASANGGGVFVGVTSVDSTLHAYNATITNNQCGVAKIGGGIFVDAGSSASIANTVLAQNYERSKSGGVPDDCNAVASLDYNLIRTISNCTVTGAVSHNIYGTDPMLGPLQDNGGPTQTEALLTGSPAIDKGNPSGCTDNFGATLTTDQRGFIRPINGRCDMGAYEFGSALPTPTPTRTPTSTPTPTPNPLARSFFTLAPCRVIDTRGAPGPLGGPALAAGATRDFVLAGTCGIPASAKAVSINVTVTGPTAAGDLRLFGGGAPLPLVSTINYRAMQTRANNAVVTLGTSGDIAVLSDQASGTVQFILDVDGYFQ
jgi:CSLREA domain-containing protein